MARLCVLDIERTGLGITARRHFSVSGVPAKSIDRGGYDRVASGDVQHGRMRADRRMIMSRLELVSLHGMISRGPGVGASAIWASGRSGPSSRSGTPYAPRPLRGPRPLSPLGPLGPLRPYEAFLFRAGLTGLEFRDQRPRR